MVVLHLLLEEGGGLAVPNLTALEVAVVGLPLTTLVEAGVGAGVEMAQSLMAWEEVEAEVNAPGLKMAVEEPVPCPRVVEGEVEGVVGEVLHCSRSDV
jgi:hypothetical protein